MEMKAQNIQAVLRDLPELKITENTTSEEADAAFRELGSLNQASMNVGRFVGETPWERHPNGDELLYFLDGEVDITLMTEDGPVQVSGRAGSIFVVPQGMWHKQYSAQGITTLSAIPRPSDVSFALDPRQDA